MYVCMYVCMVIYVRATANSLDCHVGTMINRRQPLQNISVFSHAQNCSSDIDGSRTVSGNEFHRIGPEYEKLRCP